MTNDRTSEAAVREVLSVALGRPISRDERPRRADETAWDSLKHIEIVFMLEEELGIAFDVDEMPRLNSLDEIVRLADAKRAA